MKPLFLLALAAPQDVTDAPTSAVPSPGTSPVEIGSSETGSGEMGFAETIVRVPRDRASLALRDLDGDGRKDLVWVDKHGLSVRDLGSDGTFVLEPSAQLKWSSPRIAWDLVDLDGDGSGEVALLADGEVRVHRLRTEGGFDEGEVLLKATSYLPAGTNRVHFVRDVDGDGRPDVVLPGAGAHRIFLRQGDGWADPIEIAYEAQVQYQVGDPDRLDSYFGQGLDVPWFTLEDVDGDGLRDLVSETSDRVAFHLAKPTLATDPTWVLDLEALKDELPIQGGINLDDLFSLVDQRVSWLIADLDEVPPNDLIVSLGPKFRVYLGGAGAGPGSVPDQLLKSSGNVLWYFVRDVHGNGLPELQLVRAEKVSIGRVLRYLVLPGALNFDLFTYENKGGTFSRKPTRRNKVTFEIPRLLSLMNEKDGLEDKIEEQFDIPARRLPLDVDAPAAGDDIVDLRKKQVVVYRGCAPEPTYEEGLLDGDFDLAVFLENFLVADLDDKENGAVRTIDLGDLDTYDFAPGATMRNAAAGVEASVHHPVIEGSDHTLATRDLDGDDRGDVIVVCFDKEAAEWIVQFLVRRDDKLEESRQR